MSEKKMLFKDFLSGSGIISKTQNRELVNYHKKLGQDSYILWLNKKYHKRFINNTMDFHFDMNILYGTPTPINHYIGILSNAGSKFCIRNTKYQTKNIPRLFLGIYNNIFPAMIKNCEWFMDKWTYAEVVSSNVSNLIDRTNDNYIKIIGLKVNVVEGMDKCVLLMNPFAYVVNYSKYIDQKKYNDGMKYTFYSCGAPTMKKQFITDQLEYPFSKTYSAFSATKEVKKGE